MRLASDAAEAETELARVPDAERVAVVDARFVGHLHALRLGLTDPRFPLAAVPGAVTAQPAGRQALARAMARENSALPRDDAAPLRGTARPPGGRRRLPRDSGGLRGAGGSGGLRRHRPGHRPRRPHRYGPGRRRRRRAPPELGSLVATVPADPQARNEARQAVAAVDDEAVRLKTAVKSRDGFFTTFFVSPYSRYIARWCARRGLTPTRSPPPR